MFKEILLPIDLEETRLTARAIELAQDYVNRHGARVTALTVIPDFTMPVVASYFPKDTLRKAHDDVCVELDKFIKGYFDNADDVHCSVGEGSPHKVIVEYARRHGTELIIMPSSKRDISKMLLGSSTTYVVQRAPCSVMVVRP